MPPSPASAIDIAAIHRAGWQFVLAITGGGAAAIGQLLQVPGGSRSLLSATVPYSSPALIEFLSARPDQFCSEPTARAMAMAAWQQARHLANGEPAAPLVGVACTASLASDRPKRGAHRAYLAWQSIETTASLAVELQKGQRTRVEEESLVTNLILGMMSEAAGLPVDWRALGLLPSEQPLRATLQAPEAWQALLLGQCESVCTSTPPQGGAGESPRAIYPGAFNPRHAGHRHMADLAAEILGRRVEHEISIVNVDKPPLDYLEIDRRLRQFDPDEPVWLTRAPRFVDKSRLFPGATFIVGVDTIARLADPGYYGHDVAARDAALAKLVDQNCSFLVFGRVLEGRFQQLDDLDLPPRLAGLCRCVTQSQFREDVSSTALRRQLQPDPEQD